MFFISHHYVNMEFGCCLPHFYCVNLNLVSASIVAKIHELVYLVFCSNCCQNSWKSTRGSRWQNLKPNQRLCLCHLLGPRYWWTDQWSIELLLLQLQPISPTQSMMCLRQWLIQTLFSILLLREEIMWGSNLQTTVFQLVLIFLKIHQCSIVQREWLLSLTTAIIY